MQNLLLSRIDAAQHVSGIIMPIIRNSFQTAGAASGFRMNAEVDVFPAVVDHGWKHTHLGIHTGGCDCSLERAPDDGHNNARNM
jgi:hypothetical protein